MIVNAWRVVRRTLGSGSGLAGAGMVPQSSPAENGEVRKPGASRGL
jgi:hypothetical protein